MDYHQNARLTVHSRELLAKLLDLFLGSFHAQLQPHPGNDNLAQPCAESCPV
jgi:hypothetical protein